MQLKLLMFGEAFNVPHTSIGLGVGLVSLWVDGVGFTCASNNLGSLGYICLETPVVELGEVDAQTHALFTNLHGRVVRFEVSTNHFVKDGGIARVTLAIPEQQGGLIVERTVSFVADGCRGVSFVSNALNFSSEMLMMDRTVAEFDNLLDEEDLAAVAENAAAAGHVLA